MRALVCTGLQVGMVLPLFGNFKAEKAAEAAGHKIKPRKKPTKKLPDAGDVYDLSDHVKDLP